MINIKYPCKVKVGPELPVNYTGTIQFPEIVTVDDLGVETPFAGLVKLVVYKGSVGNYFEATSVAGVATLTIPSPSPFFSEMYDQIMWVPYDASTFERLYFRVDGELYDALDSSFLPEDCKYEGGDVEYKPLPEVCDPCEKTPCP